MAAHLFMSIEKSSAPFVNKKNASVQQSAISYQQKQGVIKSGR
jgi:hypothetical protein